MASQKDLLDEKTEEWLNKPDLELTDLDTNKSIKTNFLLCQRNFLNIKKWTSGLLSYLKYLRKLIDVDNIINEVFVKLRTQKLSFVIPHVWTNNPTHTEDFLGIVYTIEKIDNCHINISSRDKDFITDQMSVTVKTLNEGIIVYPVIKTKGNVIDIYFSDEISEDYIVYVI